MSYTKFVEAGKKLRGGPVKQVETDYKSLSTDKLLLGLYKLHTYYHQTRKKEAMDRIYQITKIISERTGLTMDQFTLIVKEYLF